MLLYLVRKPDEMSQFNSITIGLPLRIVFELIHHEQKREIKIY